TLSLHSLVQPWMSPSWMPLSHSSPGPTSMSPHTLISQLALQAMPGPFIGPSSHCSRPLITPSPQDSPGPVVLCVVVSSVVVVSPDVEVLSSPVSVSGPVVVVDGSEPVGLTVVMSVVPLSEFELLPPTVASVVGSEPVGFEVSFGDELLV